MKKIYVSPSLKVVKVELAQMIAASEQVAVGSHYSGGTIESRGGSVWDDDDDDY